MFKKISYTGFLFIAPILTIISLMSCNRQSYDEKKSHEIAEFNKTQCPKRMDEYTLMDSMHYDTGSHILTYYYTIQGKPDSAALYTAENVESIRQNILKGIRSSLDIKDLKDHDITFIYNYTSQTTQKQLMNLKFTPKDYK